MTTPSQPTDQPTACESRLLRAADYINAHRRDHAGAWPSVGQVKRAGGLCRSYAYMLLVVMRWYEEGASISRA